jgi:hypothetical protein
MACNGDGKMTVLSSPLFTAQLRAILAPRLQADPQAAKSFKLYLDTVLLNLPTKASKYKPSIYFDDPGVKEIEHQGCTIPFYYDKARGVFILLGIIDNRPQPSP